MMQTAFDPLQRVAPGKAGIEQQHFACRFVRLNLGQIDFMDRAAIVQQARPRARRVVKPQADCR